MLPPFLFIPFVENAIKHNVGLSEPSYAHMEFHAEGRSLSYRCVNSRYSSPVETHEKSGIGLMNVRKRLQILFPGALWLEFENRDNLFIVKLTIHQYDQYHR